MPASKIFAWLSLLTCVSVTCLGILSHYRDVVITMSRDANQDWPFDVWYYLDIGGGRIMAGRVQIWDVHDTGQGDPPLPPRSTFRPSIELARRGESFAYWSDNSDGASIIILDQYTFPLPLWLITVLIGIYPILILRRSIKLRRRIGFCVICGYDLRATPDRCPECGTIRAGKVGER